mgnify:CR=1 FL=1
MTSDVFGAFLTYLPTLISNQILYYINLCSKIRCSLTYLPKNLNLHVNALQDIYVFNTDKVHVSIKATQMDRTLPLI